MKKKFNKYIRRQWFPFVFALAIGLCKAYNFPEDQLTEAGNLLAGIPYAIIGFVLIQFLILIKNSGNPQI